MINGITPAWNKLYFHKLTRGVTATVLVRYVEKLFSSYGDIDWALRRKHSDMILE